MERPTAKLTATVLDSRDARELAGFYERLLGWERGADEDHWVSLRSPDGGPGLAFQTDDTFVRPTWPAKDGAHQRIQMHLDIEVEDLEAAGTHAVELGAELADTQIHPDVRVYLDPAGHPFCLWVRAATADH